VEPGTAVFVVAHDTRRDHDVIAAKLVESNAEVLFSGGERDFLPEGVDGKHGKGTRNDDRNLIEEAEAAGYRVVYTREELMSLPNDAARNGNKVLGLFAEAATFNDQSEEELTAAELPLFDLDAPTLAEMTDVAIRLLSANDRNFFLVVEEEGTDNFGNKNNASGVLESGHRADQAMGVAQRYLDGNPDTLILTAADSDGGGLRMHGYPVTDGRDVPAVVPETAPNGSPMDGVNGPLTPPFLAAPDQYGQSLPFAVTWSDRDDISGGVVVRAAGYNADQVFGTMDNTELAKLMRRTLFGSQKR
jgi:alkaline phosphatase